MKKGIAMIYIVLAMMVIGTIMSYVLSKVNNVEISQLDDVYKIKQIYEKDINNLDSIYESIVIDNNLNIVSRPIVE